MEKTRSIYLKKFVQLFCVVLCAAMAVKWEKIFLGVCAFDLHSDLPLHVELALGHNDYGLASVLLRALYGGGDMLFAQRCLSVILTLNNILMIFSLWALLRYLLPRLEGCYALLAAELALVCGPWLIPGYQMQIYAGAHNGNFYHNITALFSRTLIPLCIVFFCRCTDALHGKIRAGDCLALAGTLLVITLFKPNFAFALIPVLAIMLIYDFIKYRGRNIKNEFILGCAVIPAGLTCIWQYLVLYDDSFAGTSSTMVFGFTAETGVAALLIMYLRSLLLPIYTIPQRLCREPEHRHIIQLLIFYGVALLEATFINENGYRATHGNFEWGALMLYPAIFALGIAMLFCMIREAKPCAADRIKCLAGLVLLLGHVAVGAYYMYAVNAGIVYYI